MQFQKHVCSLKNTGGGRGIKLQSRFFAQNDKNPIQVSGNKVT